MRCLWCAILVGVLAVWPAGPARGQGGPPLFTDDPDTPGAGKWEINLGWTLLRGHRERTQEMPHLDLNYGLGDRNQLKYEASWLVLDEAGRSRRSGLSNSLVGWKFRFLDQVPNGVNMGVYPQLGFNNPTSSVRRGIARKGADLLLPVVASRRFGPVTLDAEFGYDWVSHGPDEWIYGFATGWELTERFEATGEIYGMFEPGFRNHQPLINFGGRATLTEHLKLLFALGHGLRDTRESPGLIAYLGLQFLF